MLARAATSLLLRAHRPAAAASAAALAAASARPPPPGPALVIMDPLAQSLGAAGGARTAATAGGAGAGVGGASGGAAAGPPAGAAPGIVRAIEADHRRLFSYCEQLRGAALSGDEAERVRHKLVHDLSVHSLSEEEVLYPALKNAFGKDIRRAGDHVLDEHTSLKKILLDIDRMSATDPGFQPRLEQLYQELKHHVKEEEENVLPAFSSRVTPADLEELGERFERTKGKAPTRPHTMAPDKPRTGNVIADRVTAPLDKARDALSGRDV
ncbi:hypothetical protein Rsub_10161 [Raphidocelis subcapitata]|uniref:Hemerythrin-like domain-containing protein n=1 Tax=Raphidocelis subcapitata TaxID=307507 RepID=A0A2V0PI36_9CHLO|nr:hypothetical protein Rsub_10161 [Raphidocelis subcapitata]|eukprot:GBF97560.1 hypothetical protein Rsub_10161 [Raphidocelis subcapitata]